MARIAGINIPNHQHADVGLTAIYGVGRSRARKICEATGVPFDKKVKDLTDADLEKIRDQIGQLTIEGDLRRETTMNIKRLMDIGCYRGLFVAFECKAGKGKTTALQEREINAIRTAKGLAFVINEENVDQLKELLQWTKK